MLKLTYALCPPNLLSLYSLFLMYPFIFQWGNQSDLCSHHTVTGKASKILHKLSIVRDSREQIPGEGSRTCH